MIVKMCVGTWMPVEEEHRCSAKRCLEPAVIYRTGIARHYDRPTAHEFRRFLCQQHLEQYRLELRHGRVYFGLSCPRTIVEEHEVRVWQRNRA